MAFKALRGIPCGSYHGCAQIRFQPDVHLTESEQCSFFPLFLEGWRPIGKLRRN